MAEAELGVRGNSCLYDRELHEEYPDEHYYCDFDEVLAMMIGEYRTFEPLPEDISKKIREMNPTLNLFSDNNINVSMS